MSHVSVSPLLVLVAVLSSFGLGAAVGWALRSRRAGDEEQRRQHAGREQIERATQERDAAVHDTAEMREDMMELATRYRELHDAYEDLSAQHKAKLFQLAGVEDELRVQEESARVARAEAGTARRRVGQLEADLRGLQRVAAKVVNES